MSAVFPNSNRFPKINDAEIYIGDSQKRPKSKPISGDAILDNTGKLTIPQKIFARVVKSADETRNSTTDPLGILRDDSELFISLNPNTVYGFLFFLMYESEETPDFKYGLIPPSGSGGGKIAGTWTGSSSTGMEPFIVARGLTGISGLQLISSINGRITTGVNAGDFRVQWSQFTVDSADSTMLAGSYISVWET